MKSEPAGQPDRPENVNASSQLRDVSTDALLPLARKERRKFDQGRQNLQVTRKRLFAISQMARTRGELAMGREVSKQAWAIEPDNLTAGTPTDWQVLSNPGVQVKITGIAQERSVVFIMGCARSGTTVTQHLFSTISDPIFFWGEKSLVAVAGDWPSQGETLVLKRRSVCHLYIDMVPDAVKVIWMVRHPYSVITSKHRSTGDIYYVSTERWLKEFAAYKWLRDHHPSGNFAVIRYEDLTKDPDAVQGRLKMQTGLRFDVPFSKFEGRKNLVGRKGKWQPLQPGRAFDTAAFAHHRERLDQFIAEAGPALDEFAKEFGYDIWK